MRDLGSVDPAAWDALDHGGSPFLEHGFLRALELSRSISGSSGWDPYYLLVELPAGAGSAPGAALLGAVACFVKDHSYGEYIFDFAWASASARARIPYYPKLVIAAPVTPATGPRILLHPALGEAADAVEQVLVTAVRELADTTECRSIHWLFTTEREHERLSTLGFLPRETLQYHFHNPGYADFDAFLAELASRKRKQIRKERARARAEVDAIDFVSGPEWSDDDVAAMERFYRGTVAHHGGHAYLRPGFFGHLRRTAAHRVAFARARKNDRTIAGALYLEGERALFGRYWGCDEPVPLLHFELAVYLGIERCITRGLPLFEAGAQGEHKLLRGFEPTRTFSSHWIRHDGLHRSVERFLAEERRSTTAVVHELERLLPYRAGEGDP